MNVAAQFSVGESIFFWIIAVIMVCCALGVALSRKAIHAAVCMVGLMLCLAMIYISQGAYFLGVVQVVVYTGAIMMLILFVIMMVGVAASDNYRRTQAGLRWGAWILGIIGIAIMATALISANLVDTGAIQTTGNQSNPVQLALVIFSQHLLTLQIVATLLIIACVGAMSLTHSDRLNKLFLQPETAKAKMLEYGAGRRHPGQLPAPGVYAESNSPDVPAISGETHQPVDQSVPRVLRATGQDRSIAEVSPSTVMAMHEELNGDSSRGLHSISASKEVGKSGAWGMPGPAASTDLKQPGMHQVVLSDTPDQPDTEAQEDAQ